MGLFHGSRVDLGLARKRGISASVFLTVYRVPLKSKKALHVDMTARQSSVDVKTDESYATASSESDPPDCEFVQR